MCLALLALTNPAVAIGNFVLIAFVAAIASASHDIAIDAWRIDQADEDTPIELLSAVYQFGYRTASIVGGAVALVLAARMSWPNVYLVMAAIFVALVAGHAHRARQPAAGARHALRRAGRAGRAQARRARGAARNRRRELAVGDRPADHVCGVDAAPAAPGAAPPSVADFTKTWGVLIIVATVFVPLACRAVANLHGERARTKC